MENSESFYRRERFEASLRRCGWKQEEITYEWYKVQEDNLMHDIYTKRLDESKGFLNAISFLQKLNRVV